MKIWNKNLLVIRFFLNSKFGILFVLVSMKIKKKNKLGDTADPLIYILNIHLYKKQSGIGLWNH